MSHDVTSFTLGVEPRLFALVPCAGTGSRSGSFVPKQYAPVAGQAMVAHTLQALARVDRLAATLVVLAPDDEQFEEECPGFAGERGWVARVGGASRAETVANGLAELKARGAQPLDWVLVHDAARCLLRASWVDRLIDACIDDEVGGLLALPLADTLKQERHGRASATVDREGKWAAQTPQMFRLGLVERALAAMGAAATDEASAVEALGHRPRLVRGDWENLKVTFPGDFALAERLLQTSRRGTELRPVLPARDFALSQQFYADLGFTREFVHGQLAGFTWGGCAFLLQQAPETPPGEAAPAAPLTLHLTLADLEAFWARIQREGLAERYGLAVAAPVQRAWGRADMALTDPNGVRWQISQRLEGVE